MKPCKRNECVHERTLAKRRLEHIAELDRQLGDWRSRKILMDVVDAERQRIADRIKEVRENSNGDWRRMFTMLEEELRGEE